VHYRSLKAVVPFQKTAGPFPGIQKPKRERRKFLPLRRRREDPGKRQSLGPRHGKDAKKFLDFVRKDWSF